MLQKMKDKLFPPKKPINYYITIGQENGVFELVKNFYTVMESDPKTRECLLTHELNEGKVIDETKKKFFMFLCGWFGGPNLFIEAYGSPRMRSRHLHIAISDTETQQWLSCMSKALDMHSIKIKKYQKEMYMNSFKAIATRIRNTKETSEREA